VPFKFHNLFIVQAFVISKVLVIIEERCQPGDNGVSFHHSATSACPCGKTDALSYKNRLYSTHDSRSLIGPKQRTVTEPVDSGGHKRGDKYVTYTGLRDSRLGLKGDRKRFEKE
jgi:hypothetical protein